MAWRISYSMYTLRQSQCFECKIDLSLVFNLQAGRFVVFPQQSRMAEGRTEGLSPADTGWREVGGQRAGCPWWPPWSLPPRSTRPNGGSNQSNQSINHSICVSLLPSCCCQLSVETPKIHFISMSTFWGVGGVKQSTQQSHSPVMRKQFSWRRRHHESTPAWHRTALCPPCCPLKEGGRSARCRRRWWRPQRRGTPPGPQTDTERTRTSCWLDLDSTTWPRDWQTKRKWD